MHIFFDKDEECFDKYNEIRKKLAILSQKKKKELMVNLHVIKDT